MTVYLSDGRHKNRHDFTSQAAVSVNNCHFHCQSPEVGGAIQYINANGECSIDHSVFDRCYSGMYYATFDIRVLNFVTTQICIYRTQAVSHVSYGKTAKGTNKHQEMVIVGSTGTGVLTYFDLGDVTMEQYNSSHNELTYVAGYLGYTEDQTNSLKYAHINNNRGDQIMRVGGGTNTKCIHHCNIIDNKPLLSVVCAQDIDVECTDIVFRNNAFQTESTIFVGRLHNFESEFATFTDCHFDFPESAHLFATFSQCFYGSSLSRNIAPQVYSTAACVIPSPRRHAPKIIQKPMFITLTIL